MRAEGEEAVGLLGGVNWLGEIQQTGARQREHGAGAPLPIWELALQWAETR